MRPADYTILQAQENERGDVEVWVEADGHTLHFLVHHKALLRGTVEDHIADHFDRFEEQGHDWKTQRAPDRTRNRRGKARPEFHGRRQMRGKRERPVRPSR